MQTQTYVGLDGHTYTVSTPGYERGLRGVFQRWRGLDPAIPPSPFASRPAPEPEPQQRPDFIPPQTPPPPEPKVTVLVFPLLELSAPFSRAEVLAAYRKRALQLHPDQGGFAPRFIQLVAEREHALALAD